MNQNEIALIHKILSTTGYAGQLALNQLSAYMVTNGITSVITGIVICAALIIIANKLRAWKPNVDDIDGDFVIGIKHVVTFILYLSPLFVISVYIQPAIVEIINPVGSALMRIL